MYSGYYPPPASSAAISHPPVSFVDQIGREIDLRVYGDGPVENEFEALVEMYLDFDPAHRTLGIPPGEESRIRAWLEKLLDGYCVVAWEGDRVAGQAVLAEDRSGSYELAIFLHQDYHRAWIGTYMMWSLFSYGRQQGVERVWLLVERENRIAVNLYHDVGFVVTEARGSDVEMSINLSPMSN
ncbi:GNAT family N-acetyltransferase [Halococcus saccharolyticus]|uniref:HAT (Histone acetyltransferase) family protein n=1 Tax=Halococcus saccharolyticus DSM 5350 TaxID=1227455 RepID=M0MJZ5_9EURY|nr:GNAT family N-acetyltransferase [Halococcus saccharolyticus]EMA45997.1 HAT (histone acetyltransferase) family protein [Halococcus saccharolyticus DSM 5350]